MIDVQKDISDLCVFCYNAPKSQTHRFCSSNCAFLAAAMPPTLLHIRPDNQLYHGVESKFRDSWEARSEAPAVKEIYMVTWTKDSQDEFQQYRAYVESNGQFVLGGFSPGNERKYFRGSKRACTIGEDGNTSICTMKSCNLCEGLRVGFGPYLSSKQRYNCPNGYRLGAGIYSTPNPAKATKYAENLIPSSTTNVIMLCRVVVGLPYQTDQEQRDFFEPPGGYDSVYASGRRFKSDECVVYNSAAIRPAYLIIF